MNNLTLYAKSIIFILIGINLNANPIELWNHNDPINQLTYFDLNEEKNGIIIEKSNSILNSPPPFSMTYTNSTSVSFVDIDCDDQGFVGSTIDITDDFIISDVNLGMIADMDGRRADLTATLTSPWGTIIQLTSSAAHGSPSSFNDWDIYFDDASSGLISDMSDDDITAPNYENDRTAEPNNRLSHFNGRSAKGIWTLNLCDKWTSFSNGGTLLSWKLDFEGTDCTANSDDPVPAQGTCSGTDANNDASVSISNIVNADKADISLPGAAFYNGDDYAAAETISGTTISFTGLYQSTKYIIRIYETGGACYTEKYFTTPAAPSACPNTPIDLPWGTSFLNNKQIILKKGIGVSTKSFSTRSVEEERFALSMMNLENMIPVSRKRDVTLPTQIYNHPSWHIDEIGNVYGIAINTENGEVLVTASSNFSGGFLTSSYLARFGTLAGGTANGQNDSAAGGAVYRIDPTTGQASVFAMLPQQSFNYYNISCEASNDVERTNSGTGLGNVVYD